MIDDKAFSKTLSYWLRHRPDEAGLALDAAGWAPVAPVLAALGANGLDASRNRLDAIVAGSDKARFELSADGASIRARQGHSVAVDLGWPWAAPPALLFHGTVSRFLPAIRAEGLKPMARHHVHLSPDRATAAAVGARRGTAVILTIMAAELAATGAAFYLTDNRVWLTDTVPPAFITEG